MFDLNNLPHKKIVLMLLATALLVILTIETTSLRFTVYNLGILHLASTLFSFGAIGVLLYPGWITDGGIKDFSRLVAGATSVLGAAHIVEFFGETIHVIGKVLTFAVFSSGYFLAGIIVLVGASRLLHRGGVDTKSISTSLVTLVVCMATALYAWIMGGYEAWYSRIALIVTLVLAGVVYMRVLGIVAKKMPVLGLFSVHLRISSAIILVSYAMELFRPEIVKLGLSSIRIENFSHYFLYLGLSLMLLSFDLLRHFKGVYADIKAEAGMGHA